MTKGLLKDTICIHSGNINDLNQGSIISPIYRSTIYKFPNEEQEVFYPRYLNLPNQKLTIDKINKLEDAANSMIFSSGMAAISTTLLSLLEPGDHAIFNANIYGGTFAFLHQELTRLNISFDLVYSDKVAEHTKYIKKNTKLIYAETPTNPLLDIINLQEFAEIFKKQNILTIIDNTFATPINQNPLNYGIDVVIHSGTKYLGGHSDLMCGTVSTNKKSLINIIKQKASNYGGILDAENCYLLERSLKTLFLRIERQNHNALKIANFLEQHSNVRKVFYPGLESHPQYSIAKTQMKGFGGMISFIPRFTQEEIEQRMKKLNLFIGAPSLGGVETTYSFPIQTSHRKIPNAEREKQGITDNLIRLSIGIENAEDLIKDLDKVL